MSFSFFQIIVKTCLDLMLFPAFNLISDLSSLVMRAMLGASAVTRTSTGSTY